MMITKSSSLILLGITLLLMLFPLMANWLRNDFHWKLDDFMLMGVMIYITGFINIRLINIVKNKILRWIIGLLILMFLFFGQNSQLGFLILLLGVVKQLKFWEIRFFTNRNS